ncbi:YqaA family protein [Lutimaribacter saemankumensis]|uniref:Membrane protein YqaA, SNARE-associated domain n=1 Tax=Lutimaribacter saemankumensis TaxID=490829 RepID=A0A1G8K606_9RHOB|nr:YqaA family protein [Lutimaribacter saemankumensis]SDI38864.1 membrane protein YqaA, SNARE-associated domain [Lutimaribacter saemankumensis]
MLALIGLFLAALLAATLFPAQSEAVLVALLLNASHPVWLLLLVATAGNVLGAILNWAIGRWLGHLGEHPRMPVSASYRARAEAWYRRWGWMSLFGSWLPFIGDPLTVVAGALREPLWRFTIVVTAAKAGRYLVLAAITLAVF